MEEALQLNGLRLEEFQDYILGLSKALLEVFENSFIPSTLPAILIYLAILPTIVLCELDALFEKKFQTEFSIIIWKAVTLWMSLNEKPVNEVIPEMVLILEKHNIYRHNDGDFMRYVVNRNIVDTNSPRLLWGFLKFLNGLPKLFKEDEYDDIAGLEPLQVVDLKKLKKQGFFNPIKLLETVVTLINNDEYDEELIDPGKTLIILDILLNSLPLHQSLAASANEGLINSLLDKLKLHDIMTLNRPKFYSTNKKDILIGDSLSLKIALQSNIGVSFENAHHLCSDALRSATLHPAVLWSQLPEIIYPLIFACLEQDWTTISKNKDILTKMIKVHCFMSKTQINYFFLDIFCQLI